jgi:chromate transporter
MSNSEAAPAADPASAPVAIPHQTLLQLFVRFLRCGCLAWGGPVVQIGMLRHDLVEEERWISPQQVNRVLALAWI